MVKALLQIMLVWASMLWIPAMAQPPAGYYDSAAGLTGKALQQALHDIIDGHTELTYSGLWNCFLTTDKKPDGTVWDIYSDIPGGTPPYSFTFITDQCGNYSREGDCYNREHIFPRSWFTEGSQMYTDLFHIYPTDGWVNNKRGNLPFGETSSPNWVSANGSKTGPFSTAGFQGEVFEPLDAYKGDIARSLFYVATRYYGESGDWPGSAMTERSEPKPWALDLLLKWHTSDAVSQKEIQRNEEVFKYQKNRNPFIDDPLFAGKIWGGVSSTPEMRTGEPLAIFYPNPVKETLHLQFNRPVTGPVTIILSDLRGLMVMKITIMNTQNRIPVYQLPPGLYVLTIITPETVQTETLLKSEIQ